MNRRFFLRGLGVSAAAALVAACQAPTPAASPTVAAKPTSADAAPTTAAPPAKPTTAASQPAATAATQPAAQAAPNQGWEQQWNDLIAQARQGGKIVVSGPPNPDLRESLTTRFKARFGIELEYLPLPPNQGEFINRLVSEKAAGVSTVDVLVGGAQSMFTVAYPAKIMSPIMPVLVLPEVLDGSKWNAGKVWFRDPDNTYFMQIANYQVGHMVINRDFLNPDEIKSWKDLLDPKYRGKISAWDPSVPGTGWATANWLRVSLGDDYIKQIFLDQKAGIPADYRQWNDWMARGTYPIALGPRSNDVEDLERDGFKLTVRSGFPEAQGLVTGGYGLVMLIEKAPNPAAAKVFANWIAAPEGQEAWSRPERIPSVRTDMASPWAPSYTVVKNDVKYFDSYDWNYTLTGFAESVPIFKQILAQRR
jgi:iron(III) transport system substrate-binding protein